MKKKEWLKKENKRIHENTIKRIKKDGAKRREKKQQNEINSRV